MPVVVLVAATMVSATIVLVAYLLARASAPAPPPALSAEVEAILGITKDLMALHRDVVAPRPAPYVIPDPFDDGAAQAAIDLLHDPSPDPAEFGPLGELDYDPAFHDQPGLVVEVESRDEFL
jgi:hypothetical protein